MVASNILLPKPEADTEIIAGVDDGVITTVLLQVARTEQVIAGDGMADDSSIAAGVQSLMYPMFILLTIGKRVSHKG